MKIAKLDSPDISDATCKAKTGKTMQQWFAALDTAGGIAKGRREMTNFVYGQIDKDAWWAATIVVEYERARGQKEKDGKPTGYSICSTKTIAAPLGDVFRAFGTAKTLDAWLGKGTTIAFKDGGRFENADGDRATIKRIRADKDIRLTWDRSDLGPGTAVEVMFADKGKGKTGITLNHTRIQTRREADSIREGWSASLEALKAHIESR